MMESWSAGVLEYWPTALLHHSITPSLHCSATPLVSDGLAGSNAAVAHAPQPHGTGGGLVCVPGDGAAGVWLRLLCLSHGRAQRLVPEQGALLYLYRSCDRPQGRRPSHDDGAERG